MKPHEGTLAMLEAGKASNEQKEALRSMHRMMTRIAEDLFEVWRARLFVVGSTSDGRGVAHLLYRGEPHSLHMHLDPQLHASFALTNRRGEGPRWSAAPRWWTSPTPSGVENQRPAFAAFAGGPEGLADSQPAPLTPEQAAAPAWWLPDEPPYVGPLPPETQRHLRVGEGYELPEKYGSNPLPAVGMSGAALSAFWRELLADTLGVKAMRVQATRAASEALQTGDNGAFVSAMEARWAGKIESKTLVGIARRVHEIIAPLSCPLLCVCDADCEHMERGAGPEKVKRVLDTLDAAVMRAQRSIDFSTTSRDSYFDGLDTYFSDLLDERSVYSSYRRLFARALTPHS